MYSFLIASRSGIWAANGFVGKVLDEWSVDTQEFIRSKLPHLVIVALIAFVLNRLLSLVSARMIRIAELHAPGESRVSQVRTLAGVIRTTGLAIIAAIVSMQFLAAVGVNLAPLLASAGVAGVAIGLAAQNIVRDMLNGILILIEDQFNVGDTVRVAGVQGVVEAMTLRKTTIRDPDGTRYVIPNSQITTVANQSIDYSVTTVNVSVDYSANPDTVQEMLKSIAMEVRNSDEFRELFVADPQILGVDAIKGSELIFPVVFKTRATKQYAPVREFRRRVRLAFEKDHILPGNPYRVSNPSQESAGGITGNRLEEPAALPDPTTIRAAQSNPFSAE
ncbi:MAG TPA: mechanosensitive ion channel family protein [Terracidiphilus sp.]|nr:mechanosensitive ion channel family protein [Terracidiphilus sp.]